jgi:hypothetical protein
MRLIQRDQKIQKIQKNLKDQKALKVLQVPQIIPAYESPYFVVYVDSSPCQIG